MGCPPPEPRGEVGVGKWFCEEGMRERGDVGEVGEVGGDIIAGWGDWGRRSGGGLMPIGEICAGRLECPTVGVGVLGPRGMMMDGGGLTARGRGGRTEGGCVR